MKQIIAFELRKLFRNRLILFMLILFGILNLCRICSDHRRNTGGEKSYWNGRNAVYHEVSGPWDNEKIRYVLAEYEKAKAVIDAGGYSTEPDQPGTHTGFVFGDWGLFEQIRDDMDRRYHYDSTMADLTQKASENAAFYAQKGNSEAERRNQKIADTYQNRRVTAFYDTWGTELYLKYDFSTLLILMLMIPMLSPLFVREHESGMHALLRLTPDYRKLPYAKLLAGLIAVTLVSLFFFAEDFLTFRYLYQIRGLSQPVYSLPDFFYSPLTCSIGCYLLLNAALKLLGLLVLAGICTAVSAAVKHELIPFCCASAAALILLLADAFLDSTVLSVLNPVTLFWCGRLFRDFQTISVCGIPVFSFRMPVLAAALEWLLLSVLTVALGRLSVRTRRRRHEI